MDPLPTSDPHCGVFLTEEARSAGHTGRTIAAAVRRGEWHRVRRGAFVAAATWAAATPEQRHLIVAAAVHRSYGDSVSFSHTTAALLHGLPVWGVDLTRVHVTRLDTGAGRVERDLVHHESSSLTEGGVVRVGGRLMTVPARAALEHGLLCSTESSLVTLDALLFTEQASVGDVGTAYDLVQHWPASQHLQVAVRMADAGAQSPGESRARWLFFTQGLPAPALQHPVHDADGRLIGCTDFAWPRHRTLGEFDGRSKYGRLLAPGQLPGDAVFAEKQREDAMRLATGFGMVRLVWQDLERPSVTGRRLRTYLDPAA